MNARCLVRTTWSIGFVALGPLIPAEALGRPADPAIACITTGGGRYDLAVMNADGTGRAAIWSRTAALEFPAWSPDLDGNPSNGYRGTIAVTGWEPGRSAWVLYAIDVLVSGNTVLGADVRELVAEDADPTSTWRPRQAEWSPDLDGLNPGYQGRIAFMSSTDGYITTSVNAIDMFWDEVTAQPVFGPNSSIVLWDGQTGIGERYPTWSPDGTRIAFFASNSIFVMDAATGVVTTMIPGFDYTWSDLQWSRQGSRVALARSGLYTLDVSVGASSLVFVGGASNRAPTWSPDDAFLASQGPPPPGPNYARIYLLNLSSGQQTTLASDRKKAFIQPDWRRF